LAVRFFPSELSAGAGNASCPGQASSACHLLPFFKLYCASKPQSPRHLDIGAVHQTVLKKLSEMAQSLPKPRRASVENATDGKFPTVGPHGPPETKKVARDKSPRQLF